MIKRFGLGVLFCLQSFIGLAQIQISYPVNRIVLQRDQNNQAQVTVAGIYSQSVDRIEARFAPVWGGSGNDTGWITVQNFPTKGFYNGSVSVSGGWYTLEVRAILNGSVIATSRIDRVGVGEVFIVAGQSNAQGSDVYSGGGIGANDDRVNVIDYYDNILDETKLPFQFTQMGNFKRMAPYNFVPWFWSRLGDRLAQRLNVPVLFYGAALGGIGSSAWRRSSNGEDLRRELPLFIAVAGMPYRALKAALQHYVTRTGVRAVLWQQGESDDPTPEDLYYDNLKTVIERSRTDAHSGNLAWAIARSSRNPDPHPNVTNAQTRIVRDIYYAFPGPDTDLIYGAEYRKDGVHFFERGLTQAAEAWNNSLSDEFFNNAQPLKPQSLLSVTSNCNLNGSNISYTLSAPSGFTRYSWSTGQTSSSITVTNGVYSVKATDAVGNTYFSQPILVSTLNTPNTPNINVGGNTTFCEGSSVQLTSSVAGGNLWSNGERTQSINATNGGSYSVISYSLYGCPSNASGSVSINVIPAPQNNIVSSRLNAVCPDDTLTLSATNLTEKITYRWNTGETTPKITIKSGGVYSLVARGQNGCERVSYINVEQRNRPTSIIQSDKPTTFCTGETANLFPDNDFVEYQWNTGEKTKSINVKTSGNYWVKVKDIYGCSSEQINAQISVMPLPTSKIVADGLDKFCEGNSVRLFSSLQTMRYFWNTGESTKDVFIARPGTYTLQVADEYGCKSIKDSVVLKYIPPPSVSITGDNGLNAFCSGSSLSLSANPASAYFWSTGENTNKITVNRAGTYTLRIRDDKNCFSNPLDIVVSEKANAPIPVVSLVGTYELEARVTPLANTELVFEWKQDNTILKSVESTAKASNSGNYSVRAGYSYNLSNNKKLVCYSAPSANFNYNLPLNDKGFTIYPNPSPDGEITIETRQNAKDVLLNILAQNGQIVYSTTVGEFNSRKKLNLSNLSTGIYTLQLSGVDFYKAGKFFIK